MKKIKNLVGQTFGRLTVLEYSHKDRYGAHHWKCLCECGNITYPTTYRLSHNKTKSCGCLHNEIISNTQKKHGLYKTRLYSIYDSMKQRCLNKNSRQYKHYGLRGIIICNEWLKNFINFYNWSIGNGYEDNLTLDRINVNGNYEPNNCRWITQKEQARNTRKNKYVTYSNQTHCISEWAEKLNCSKSLIIHRIKIGMDLETVFDTNKKFKKQFSEQEKFFILKNYKTMPYANIAKILNRTTISINNYCKKNNLRKNRKKPHI